MARGKHGEIATVRREAASVGKEISDYRHKVATQQAEISKLRAEAESTRTKHDERVRQLSAEVTEGTSAELNAARLIADDLRDEVGKARSSERDIRTKWITMNERLHEWLKSDRGMTSTEAIEFSMVLMGSPPMLIVDNKFKGVRPESAVAIARARGERR